MPTINIIFKLPSVYNYDDDDYAYILDFLQVNNLNLVSIYNSYFTNYREQILIDYIVLKCSLLPEGLVYGY